MSQTPNQQPDLEQVERDIKAIELIRASGILNPNITLDKLMEITQKANEIQGGATSEGKDSFIHKHFIYTHED